MNPGSLPAPLRACRLSVGLALSALPLPAAEHVMIVALADQDYTQAKFADGKLKPETYVVMQGNFFGGATVDRTLERMSFRSIAGYLAHELARREYWPASSPHDADLLMVVHWGVTSPRASMQEMMGRTSLSTDTSTTFEGIAGELGGNDPATAVLWDVGERGNINSLHAEDVLRQQSDQNEAEAGQQDTAQLLGLVPTLRKYQESLLPTVQEIAVREGLREERYFIIVKVYDLRTWEKGKVNRAVWTIRLNIGAPGNNFEQALTRMARAGVNWFGRTTGEVVNVRAGAPQGTVEMPPLVILGEAK